MLARMGKTTVELFVIVDFVLLYTEPHTFPHGGLFESGGLFFRRLLESMRLFEERLIKGRDIIESLRYSCQPEKFEDVRNPILHFSNY